MGLYRIVYTDLIISEIQIYIFLWKPFIPIFILLYLKLNQIIESIGIKCWETWHPSNDPLSLSHHHHHISIGINSMTHLLCTIRVLYAGFWDTCLILVRATRYYILSYYHLLFTVCIYSHYDASTLYCMLFTSLARRVWVPIRLLNYDGYSPFVSNIMLHQQHRHHHHHYHFFYNITRHLCIRWILRYFSYVWY